MSQVPRYFLSHFCANSTIITGSDGDLAVRSHGAGSIIQVGASAALE
jgi:hypothetical protein